MQAPAILLTVGFAVFGVVAVPLIGRQWFHQDPGEIDEVAILHALAAYSIATAFAAGWLLLAGRWLPESDDSSARIAAALFGAGVIGVVPLSQVALYLIPPREPSFKRRWVILNLWVSAALFGIPATMGGATLDDGLTGLGATGLGMAAALAWIRRARLARRPPASPGPRQLHELEAEFIHRLAAERLRWHRSCRHDARTMGDLYGVVPAVLERASDRLSALPDPP